MLNIPFFSMRNLRVLSFLQFQNQESIVAHNFIKYLQKLTLSFTNILPEHYIYAIKFIFWHELPISICPYSSHLLLRYTQVVICAYRKKKFWITMFQVLQGFQSVTYSVACFNQESFVKIYICFLFPVLGLVVKQDFAADAIHAANKSSHVIQEQGLLQNSVDFLARWQLFFLGISNYKSLREHFEGFMTILARNVIEWGDRHSHSVKTNLPNTCHVP